MAAIGFTKHASDMLIERKFTEGQIVSIIENPDWKKEKEGDVWHAFKRVENRVLRVVIKGKKSLIQS